MSDEEKQAVEWLKRLVKVNKRDNSDDTFAEILLNLIKIEELKEDNKNLEDETSKEWEDKIKAKIEEVENMNLYQIIEKVAISEKASLEVFSGVKKGILYGLQSLLEKE